MPTSKQNPHHRHRPGKGNTSGVNLALVDEASVDGYLAKLNLGREGQLVEKVERLLVYLASKLVVDGKPTEFHSGCIEGDRACGGVSDVRFDACPFCGDREGAPGEGSSPREREALEALRVPVAPVVKLERKRRRAQEEPSSPVPAPVDATPAQAEAALAVRAVTDVTDDEIPPPGLVAVEDEAATVADLDKSVARIRSCVSRTFESMYDLGLELTENFTRKLYLRREKGGKVVYASWRDFVKAELAGIGLRYSYQLMRATAACTRETFAEVGVAKLNLILQTGEDEHPELIKSARGSTLTELRERVHNLRSTPATESTSDEKRSLPPPPDQARPAAPPPDPTIVTTQLRLGRTKLKLYARPPAKAAEPKRARKVADDAYALELLKNGESVAVLELLEKGKEPPPEGGVHVRYSIQLDKTGCLILQIDRSKGVIRKD